MYQRFVAIGRLTKDPEIKVTNTGTQVSNFSLAVNRQIPNANGERETDFFNCVCFGKLAENLVKFMKKGNLINIDGRLQNRSYEDNSGVKRYVTEVFCDGIVFLESKSHTETVQNSGWPY